MYCYACGEKKIPGAAFCQKCGAKLNQQIEPSQGEMDDLANPAIGPESELSPVVVEHGLLSQTPAHVESAEVIEEDRIINLAQKNRESSARFSPLVWIIPVFLLCGASAGLWYYNSHERLLNDRTLQLHKKAADFALEGKYSEAVTALDGAIALRPQYASLSSDRAAVQTVSTLQQNLDGGSELLKTDKLPEAEKLFADLEKQLSDHKEQLFDRTKTALEQSKIKLAVLKVKKEIDKLDTVEALAAKLTETDRLKGAEAAELHTQIVAKIADVSYGKAEELLKKKSFSDAVTAVESGLQYDEKNERLTALQNRIKSEKEAFERAEQERIDLALQQAAQEDLKNRTAGVDVSNLNVALTQYGDVRTTAQVKNVATKTIYSITIYYSIYNQQGQRLTSSSDVVYPYYLDPGATGNFSTTKYGYYSNVEVRIDNITWYLK